MDEINLDTLVEKALTIEAQAMACYEEYATIAEKEGYNNISHLFRGLYQAEVIHFKKLFMAYNKREPSQEEITSYKKRIKVEKKTTLENLKTCSVKEKEIWRDLYPKFSVEAINKNPVLYMIFNELIQSSKYHNDLLDKAINETEKYGDLKDNTVVVCPTCGLVMTGESPFRCPVCNELRKNFIIITQ